MLSCCVHTTTDRPLSSSTRVAVTAALGFFVLGVLLSAAGPTLPEIRARHGLDATGGALVLAALSAGAASGVGVAGRYRHRCPIPRLLTMGALSLAVGSAGVPLAPSGGLVAASLYVAGLGVGTLGLLLNLVVATSYGARSGVVLSLVSAVFGLSAVLTPLVIGQAPTQIAIPYLIAAGGALALLTLTTTARTRPTSPPAGARATRPELRTMLLLGGVLLGYVALESGVSGWETTHLRGVTSLSPGAAANAVALFWLGVTIGRVVAAPLAERWHPGRLVLTSLSLGTVSVLAAVHGPFAVVAYGVAGLMLAPVFPAVVVWHARSVPSGRGATRVFAAGLAGPVISSPILGVTTDATSAAAVPWVLAVFGVATTAAALYYYRTSSPLSAQR